MGLCACWVAFWAPLCNNGVWYERESPRQGSGDGTLAPEGWEDVPVGTV